MSPKNLPKGHEQHEKFYSYIAGKYLVQYDYREPDHGNLFSCVGNDLKECKHKRDGWLFKLQTARGGACGKLG